MFRCRIESNIAGPCFHKAATIPNEVILPDISDRPGAPLNSPHNAHWLLGLAYLTEGSDSPRRAR